ncbi:MAG: 16S rRNA (cytosine(967)-C(5))-methyltransferase RsmB [Granulosicoccus sp.]
MSFQASENIRLVCLQLMLELQTRGGSLTRLLPSAQERVAETDRAQLQAWSYGFARYSNELEGLVNQLITKPLKKKDLDIYLLLQLGVYQLRHTATAQHAAVDESVKLVKRLKKPWAKGLVNAVLRNYQRRVEELDENLNDSQKHNHPQWLLERFRADWPQQWQTICAANNDQGPMTLRVNTQRHSTQEYKTILDEQGMQSNYIDDVPQALQLVKAVPVQQLPGFKDGDVSIQDAAAQQCAQKLMNFAPSGGRLLDACAAPGGKTAHILELQHFSEVMAIDQDAERLERVQEALDRLSLNNVVTLKATDASDLGNWWDGKTFDAILLDAPCSGTGVIRRHPDIKLLRRPTDIPVLMSVQARLLDELWRTLNVGGVLLYATCSILKRENEEQVLAFLDRTPDATQAAECQQLLPGENGMDGFFYAPLIKGAQ